MVKIANAKKNKSVTFVISGYLSEKDLLDKSWLGVIRAMQGC